MLERGDLRLEVFEFLRRGDQAGVQPGAVPLDPRPDLVHVALCLRLVPSQVALLGLQRGQFGTQLTVPSLRLFVLLALRECAPAMVQTAQFRVQVGQFEEFQLCLRRCFHE